MTDWSKVPSKELTPEISVVVPCYNEAKNLDKMWSFLFGALKNYAFEIVLVDDASVDNTAAVAESMALLDHRIRVLRFQTNAGHQAAIRAGLRAARGQFIATIDADLEHPPEYLPVMLAEAKAGFDVVQMVRKGPQPGWFKNLISRIFYRFFNAISETPMQPGASDFRMISRRVCDLLNSLPERRLFLRALLPQLGFCTRYLDYAPGPARKGAPSFTFQKSFRLGVDAVFAHSTVPLKWAMRLGFIVATLAFSYGVYNVGAKFMTGRNVPGYTDLIGSVLFLGALMLLYLGILGRYMLVILDYLKNRPEYLIVDSKFVFPKKKSDSHPTTAEVLPNDFSQQRN